MFQTKESIEALKKALLKSSKKDTDFPLEKNISGDELVAIVKGNENKVATIADILSKNEDGIFRVRLPYSIVDGLSTIPKEKRYPGLLVIARKPSSSEMGLFQFTDVDIDNIEDPNKWMEVGTKSPQIYFSSKDLPRVAKNNSKVAVFNEELGVFELYLYKCGDWVPSKKRSILDHYKYSTIGFRDIPGFKIVCSREDSCSPKSKPYRRGNRVYQLNEDGIEEELFSIEDEIYVGPEPEDKYDVYISANRISGNKPLEVTYSWVVRKNGSPITPSSVVEGDNDLLLNHTVSYPTSKTVRIDLTVDGKHFFRSFDLEVIQPQPKQYSFIYSSDDFSSVESSHAPGRYDEGTSIRLALNPNSGFRFSKWVVNGVHDIQSNSYTFILNEDTSIYGRSELVPAEPEYTLSVKPARGESEQVVSFIEDSMTEYLSSKKLRSGGMANIRANIIDGDYIFSKWVNKRTGDTYATTNPALFMMDREDVCLEATLELNPNRDKGSLMIDEIHNEDGTAAEYEPSLSMDGVDLKNKCVIGSDELEYFEVKVAFDPQREQPTSWIVTSENRQQVPDGAVVVTKDGNYMRIRYNCRLLNGIKAIVRFFDRLGRRIHVYLSDFRQPVEKPTEKRYTLTIDVTPAHLKSHILNHQDADNLHEEVGHYSSGDVATVIIPQEIDGYRLESTRVTNYPIHPDYGTHGIEMNEDRTLTIVYREIPKPQPKPDPAPQPDPDPQPTPPTPQPDPQPAPKSYDTYLNFIKVATRTSTEEQMTELSNSDLKVVFENNGVEKTWPLVNSFESEIDSNVNIGDTIRLIRTTHTGIPGKFVLRSISGRGIDYTSSYGEVYPETITISEGSEIEFTFDVRPTRNLLVTSNIQGGLTGVSITGEEEGQYYVSRADGDVINVSAVDRITIDNIPYAFKRFEWRLAGSSSTETSERDSVNLIMTSDIELTAVYESTIDRVDNGGSGNTNGNPEPLDQKESLLRDYFSTSRRLFTSAGDTKFPWRLNNKILQGILDSVGGSSLAIYGSPEWSYRVPSPTSDGDVHKYLFRSGSTDTSNVNISSSQDPTLYIEVALPDGREFTISVPVDTSKPTGAVKSGFLKYNSGEYYINLYNPSLNRDSSTDTPSGVLERWKRSLEGMVLGARRGNKYSLDPTVLDSLARLYSDDQTVTTNIKVSILNQDVEKDSYVHENNGSYHEFNLSNLGDPSIEGARDSRGNAQIYGPRDIKFRLTPTENPSSYVDIYAQRLDMHNNGTNSARGADFRDFIMKSDVDGELFTDDLIDLDR